MKHFCLVLLLFCIVREARSQVEFAPIGAEWVFTKGMAIENYPPGYYIPEYEIFTCTGDTLIQGLSYRKVNELLLRQDGNRVYFRVQENDYLLYDFELVPGDSVRYYFKNKNTDDIASALYFVEELDTVMINGLSLKKFKAITFDWAHHYLYPEEYVYYERFGSEQKLVIWEANATLIFVQGWLRCYKDQEIADFKSPRFLALGQTDCYVDQISGSQEYLSSQKTTLLPNPASGYFTISTEEDNQAQYQIFDLQGKLHSEGQAISGQQITTTFLPAGLYYVKIINNKGVIQCTPLSVFH